jgi:hypothetical protein
MRNLPCALHVPRFLFTLSVPVQTSYGQSQTTPFRIATQNPAVMSQPTPHNLISAEPSICEIPWNDMPLLGICARR